MPPVQQPGAQVFGAGLGDAPAQQGMDEQQQQLVTAHYQKLLAMHGLSDGLSKAHLVTALQASTTAQEAIERLDNQLDPTAEMKRLVRAGNHQAALDRVRDKYHPAPTQDFELRPTDNYAAVLPPNTPIPTGVPFGVVADGKAATGKQSVIWMHTQWVERWILENQIGSLLNTIEHEAIHTGQKNSQTTKFRDNSDVMELEAYTREILLAHEKKEAGNKTLPTQAQLKKAYEAGGSHLARVKTSIPDQEQGTYLAKWQQVETVYPDLIKFLGENDERRGASGPDEARFLAAVDEYALFEEELERDQPSYTGNDFRDLESRADVAYRKAMATHQELSDGAQARHKPAELRMDAIRAEFTRYRMSGPKKKLGAKPKAAASSSSNDNAFQSFQLAPPPGFSGFGLPPPPKAQTSAQPAAAFDAFDADFGDFEGAKEDDAFDADFGDFEGAKEGAGDAFDFGEFEEALPASTSTSAPAKKKDDDDDWDFGAFQGPTATQDPNS